MNSFKADLIFFISLLPNIHIFSLLKYDVKRIHTLIFFSNNNNGLHDPSLDLSDSFIFIFY